MPIRWRRLGRFNAQGEPLLQTITRAQRAVEKTWGGKVKKTTFPQPRRRLVKLFNRTYHVLQKPDILTCYGQDAPVVPQFDFIVRHDRCANQVALLREGC